MTGRRGRIRVTLAIAAAAAVLVAVTANGIPEVSADRDATDPTRVEPGSVRNAKPLWDGDVFRIRTPNTDLPPYTFSSASDERRGALEPHSNTNPDAAGVTVVGHPTGPDEQLAAGRGAQGHQGDHGRRPRVRRAPRPGGDLRPGNVRPRPGPVDHRGGLHPERHADDSRPQRLLDDPVDLRAAVLRLVARQLQHCAATTPEPGTTLPGASPDTGRCIWRTPAIPGVWHILARHIRFDTDPHRGYSEIWYTRRERDGSLKRPLVRQWVGGKAGVPLTRRRYYATLDRRTTGTARRTRRPSPTTTRRHVAARGGSSRCTSRGTGSTPGDTPIEEIDPFYTGLR